MKKAFRSLTGIFLTVILLLGSMLPCYAEAELSAIDSSGNVTVFGIEEGSLDLPCKSAILMEEKTGTVLYFQNADEALPPASVTKVMTLLLIMEALDSGTVHLDSTVTVSANAASMGGSQVFLKEGEQMVLEELLKSVVIASANDAAVALAEYIGGSVGAFVEKMNAKAKLLGMTSTTFENVTGLDDTAENHVTSAKDIALMSRALISYPDILKYSSVWMDTIRNGEFGLTNTNRLVRYYQGCTGLKTGSTAKAGFCVSATAKRDSLSLICVIMGAESRDIRNESASQLLDWGFANYALFESSAEKLLPLPMKGGTKNTCEISYPQFCAVVEKANLSSVKKTAVLPQCMAAPVKKGDTVGTVEFSIENQTIGSVPITSDETVKKISFFEILERIFIKLMLL